MLLFSTIGPAAVGEISPSEAVVKLAASDGNWECSPAVDGVGLTGDGSPPDRAEGDIELIRAGGAASALLTMT